MRILIIEDNSLKAEDIKKCISQNIVDVSIDVEQAFNTGVRRAYKENYDFIIIDNSLPYYANDMNDICPDVASIILENLEEEIIGKCIICFAFEKGEKEDYFPDLLTGIVFVSDMSGMIYVRMIGKIRLSVLQMELIKPE